MTIGRVGIVAKHGLVAASAHLARLGVWLRERGVEAVYERETAGLAGAVAQGARTMTREALPSEVDLVLVLGGDGTLLAMAARIATSGRDIPILGVNFGSLGFLTEIRIDELMPSLASVLDGTATIDERAMLGAEVYRHDAQADSRIVLNDVVFTKAALSRMIELSVWVDGGFVTRVKADGLIIASATGSTVLTPIAPHTLTNRPVVIPGGSAIEIRTHPEAATEDVFVTYDGQSGYPLKDGDVVRVRQCERRLQLVKAPARGYFEVLREKLKWGER